MNPITLSLTTYNRFDLLKKSFENVIDDPRISEIVISDDASEMEIFDKIVSEWKDHPKVKIFRNLTNQGVYRNKYYSAMYATNDWVILFDSDNVIGPDYLDKLYELPDWDEKTVYCPGRALPEFNYTRISNEPIHKGNVNALWKRPQFDACLNTMNSFFNRQEYLNVWKDDFEPISSDSIYMNYKWLEAGNKIQIVPDLQYYHRIHKGSHYVNNCARSMEIHREIEQKIRRLK